MSVTFRLLVGSTFVALLSGMVMLWFPMPEYLGKSTDLIIARSSNLNSSEFCRNHPYKVHLFSEDPLVIYIESFISLKEASQLVSLSESQFKPSVLWSDDGTVVNVDPTYRSSRTASLDRVELVRCIEDRARTFPNYDSTGVIKPLVVQRYEISNQYKDHYDWYPDGPYIDGNIESTFFVYIQANCTGGGTNFPRMKAPEDEKWCDFIDCDEPYDAGVTFKPLTGNAIFWKNLQPDGVGHKATLHAGLPVTSGMKTGLNIWTWEKASNLKKYKS